MPRRYNSKDKSHDRGSVNNEKLILLAIPVSVYATHTYRLKGLLVRWLFANKDDMTSK